MVILLSNKVSFILTANEIFDLLEDEYDGEDDVADVVDVTLFPPTESADAQSDADSDASDEPAGLVGHLPRRVLAAGAQMTVAEDGETGAADKHEKGGAAYNGPPSKQRKRAKQ